MRKNWPRLLLAGTLISLSGCMSFEIEGDGNKTPESSHGQETIHGSFYGFEWTERDPVKCQNMLGLYRVEYSTNIFYTLSSLCSLGLYVPQDIEWWCQAPKSSEDEGPSL